MKKIATMAAATLVLLALAGCQSPQQACNELGGTYVKTGSSILPMTTYVQSGSTMIPITNYVPYDTYECQGVK